MTRPELHVDVAAEAIPAWIAQPPSGIQTAGFPPHSKFAAAWANWLFNYLGAWTRELDQSCLRAVDVVTDFVPQLLRGGGGGFRLPEGAGLQNLLPEDGGTYVVLGRRLVLSAAALAAKYPSGWTLPNNSTVYAHVREERAAGGSSTADVLLSTNAVEADYEQIWRGTTDATDLVEQIGTAYTSLQWTIGVDMAGRLTVTDSEDETALRVDASNTLVPAVLVNSTLGGTAVQADIGGSTGTGFAATVGAGAGTGYAAVLTSSPAGASGFRAFAYGAGSLCNGFYASHEGAGDGLHVDHTGNGDGVHVAATGPGLAGRFTAAGPTVLSLFGGTVTSISATATGGGSAATFTGGSSSGALGVDVYPANVNAVGLQVNGFANSSTTARGVRVSAAGQAIAAELSAAGNYALTLRGDTTSPMWAEMHLSGQNADPVQVFDGAVMWHTGQRQLKLSDAVDGAYRGVWTSVGGHCHGRSVVASAFTGGFAWNNAGTVNLTGSNAPKQAGRTLEVAFTCDVRNAVAQADNYLNVRIRDPNSAADVGFGPGVLVAHVGAGNSALSGYWLASSGVLWQRTVRLSVDYAVPAAGDRTLVVEIQTATTTNLQVRNATLTCDGLY